MGGRKGSSSSAMFGGGSGASKARREIKTKLEHASPEAVAEAAIQTIATTHPAIAALYLAYRVAKFMYPIIKKGVETYEKTGDKDKATEAMKRETVKQTAKEVVSTAVSTVVGAGVDHVAQSTGGTLNKEADTFVKNAVSETISEVIT